MMTGALELSGAPVVISSYMDRIDVRQQFLFCVPKPSVIAVRIGLQSTHIRKVLGNGTKKALPISRKGLFHEGGRWDSNPRSSGPQADADGFSAVSCVLIGSCFAPVFRGQKLI